MPSSFPGTAEGYHDFTDPSPLFGNAPKPELVVEIDDLNEGLSAAIARFPNVNELTINGANVDESAFQHLLASPVLQASLQAFIIKQAPALSPGFVSNLGKFTSLRRLYLRSATGEPIPKLSALHQLEELSLDGYQANDSSIAWLSELQQLTQLSLDGANLTNEGILHLVEGLQKLRYLQLNRKAAEHQDIVSRTGRSVAVWQEPAMIRMDVGTRNSDGIIVHEVHSPYQPGSTTVRVLLPEPLPEGDKKYPVVYVLPAEAGNVDRYGDGMRAIVEQQLQRKHPAIFVAPAFRQHPWYADHPSVHTIRQESHFLHAILPLVEKHYSRSVDPERRYLLGLGSSGWGAWSLLLRSPREFRRAAAWDAPLMMEQAGLYGSLPIFGSEDNFADYQITKQLQYSALFSGMNSPPFYFWDTGNSESNTRKCTIS